jgi:hypothetical protein
MTRGLQLGAGALGIAALAAIIAVLIAAPASCACGNIYTVTNTNDSGPGSLRQAIHDANARRGQASIKFAAGAAGVIKLNSGELTVSSDVDIAGPGVKVLAVSGEHRSRVFSVPDSSKVRISELTIANGFLHGSDRRRMEHGGSVEGGRSSTVVRYARHGRGQRKQCGGRQWRQRVQLLLRWCGREWHRRRNPQFGQSDARSRAGRR